MTNQEEKEIQLTVPYIVHEAAQARAERNREMLKDRLINGMLFEPLAEKYNLSVRATQNIIYRASEQLFKHVKF